MSDFLRELRIAVPAVGVSLSEAGLVALDAHWRLLLRWNARVNLTSITEPGEAAWLHYADSLAAAPHLGAGPVADLGSGGGFPGIPLAIARPDLAFTLIEPRRKRASFLRTAVGELRLANVDVLEARHTDPPPRPFGTAVTRATFSERADLAACRRWLAPGGLLIAYRSGAAAEEPPWQGIAYRLRGEARRLMLWRA